MKFCSISDLHIKKDGDGPSSLLEKFVTSRQVQESDKIFFLGDIFDLMIGNKRQYIHIYHTFFQAILTLLDKNKEVYYIEGNHDFHLEEVMKSFFRNKSSYSDNFHYIKETITKIENNKKFLFCHGHDLDDNKAYHRWKNIYSSSSLKFFVNHILPFWVIKKIGDRASDNSKKRGRESFIYEKAKQKYREGAQRIISEKHIDYLIAGHTHIEENLTINDSVYINNGYPLEHKKFIYFDGEKMALIPLI